MSLDRASTTISSTLGAVLMLACTGCLHSLVTGEATEPTTRAPLRVLVVDGATQQPVEGAVVQFMKGSGSRPTSQAEQYAFVTNADAYRLRHASSARTGADGTAELVDAVVESDSHFAVRTIKRIDAMHAGQWGVLDPASVKDGNGRIELAPDASRRFLVRAAGVPVPAGVRIAVGVRLPRDASSKQSAQEEPDDDDDNGATGIWLAETDERGSAVLPHLAFYRRLVPAGAETLLCVLYHDDSSDSESIPFELTTGDDFVVDLQNASHIELEVVDGRGNPIERGLVEFEYAQDLASANWDDPWDRPVVDGRVMIAAVRPGRTLAVRLAAAGWCDEIVAVETPAPSGTTSNVRIPMQRRSVVVTGRLLDASSRPWPRAHVELVAVNTLASVLTSAPGNEEWTDAAGRFRLEADPELLRAAHGKVLVDVGYEMSASGGLKGSFHLGPDQGRPNAARVSIPLELEGNQVRLGDVVLRRE